MGNPSSAVAYGCISPNRSAVTGFAQGSFGTFVALTLLLPFVIARFINILLTMSMVYLILHIWLALSFHVKFFLRRSVSSCNSVTAIFFSHNIIEMYNILWSYPVIFCKLILLKRLSIFSLHIMLHYMSYVFSKKKNKSKKFAKKIKIEGDG